MEEKNNELYNNSLDKIVQLDSNVKEYLKDVKNNLVDLKTEMKNFNLGNIRLSLQHLIISSVTKFCLS